MIVHGTDFLDQFFYFQSEGFLLQSTLRSGLTALRKSNVGNAGECYSAFFSLTIGLERLMKVIILLDHMAGHDLTLPTNAELKDRYGHQLWRLWRHVQAVVGPQLRADMDNSANDEIENLVFSHLDLFAKRSRYYNLDALTGVSSGDDPLKSWKRILDQTVALHLMPEKIKSNKQAKNLAKAMKPVVFHHAFGLDHQPLSLESALSVGPLYEKANGHIVRSLLNMIRLLQRALHDASGRAQAREQEIDNSLMRIPYMYEFMDWVPFDARELLKRKTF